MGVEAFGAAPITRWAGPGRAREVGVVGGGLRGDVKGQQGEY